MYNNEKHKEIVENKGYKYIGSYDYKEITIDKKNKNKKQTYIRVKCPYCGVEYDIQLSGFKRGDKCTYCCNKYENSFAYYIQQELNEGLNKYWDWEKNELNPYLINKKGNKKIWIKCNKVNYHNSYKTICYSFYNGRRCPYCSGNKVHPKDSFAQWGIDNIDKDFLNKYWSNKNKIDPFAITPNSHKKIWIKCQEKEYHGDYLVMCKSFIKGARCPYCVNHNGIVNPKDSFGYLYPEKAKYWSDKNKKSPFEVAPKSNKKFWFICEDCGSEFESKMSWISNDERSLKCLNCTSSKGEQRIKEFLIKNNINFVSQKEFEELKGLNNGNLSYDFYLPDYNLLIEYQGEFHDGTAKISESKFLRQQEHDKRKRQYAKIHNIRLLEIWYYDFDNIEEILENNLLRGYYES